MALNWFGNAQITGTSGALTLDALKRAMKEAENPGTLQLTRYVCSLDEWKHFHGHGCYDPLCYLKSKMRLPRKKFAKLVSQALGLE